jgi:hypothetical protein
MEEKTGALKVANELFKFKTPQGDIHIPMDDWLSFCAFLREEVIK